LITETHSTPWQLLEENVSLTKEGLATKPWNVREEKAPLVQTKA
jgi:hypothetical protein